MQKIFLGSQLPLLYELAERQGQLTSMDHIDRAAKAFLQEFRRHYVISGKTIRVFAGAGRCGAYSLRIAHLLAEAECPVEVYLFYRQGLLSEECEKLRQQLIELSSDKLYLLEVSEKFVMPRIQEHDLIIDGLFGAELQYLLTGGYLGVIKKLNSSKATIVSVELPSGLFAEDNRRTDYSAVVRAHRTIAFDAPLLAFFFRENAPYIGEWTCLHLGIGRDVQDQLDTPYRHMQDQTLSPRHLARAGYSESGGYRLGQRVLCLSRQDEMLGRALLVTRGALHAGIGEVVLAAPPKSWTLLQCMQPELSLIDVADASSILASRHAYDALALTEGLGRDAQGRELLEDTLVASPQRLLLAGDATKLLLRDKKLQEKLPKETILIITRAELDEYFEGWDSTDVECLDLVKSLAYQYGVYVVLLGTHATVCTPEQQVVFSTKGDAGLQVVGASSLLAGVILGLLGQGYERYVSTLLGIQLVGLAAEIYTGRYSARSLVASSLVPLLGEAYRQLESH